MKRHLPCIEQHLPTGGTQTGSHVRDDGLAGRLRLRGPGRAAASLTFAGV
ncbi:hypothetical protein EDD93_4852 [Streptomyces sp. 840.1]|nr:hypothetical protein EDD93_4852 [Streptomyces sp. 840.1]